MKKREYIPVWSGSKQHWILILKIGAVVLCNALLKVSAVLCANMLGRFLGEGGGGLLVPNMLFTALF